MMPDCSSILKSIGFILVKIKGEGVCQLDIYNFYVTKLNGNDQITINVTQSSSGLFPLLMNKHWTVLICYQAG